MNDTRSGTYFTAIHDLQERADETTASLLRQKRLKKEMEAKLCDIEARRTHLKNQMAEFKAAEDKHAQRS